MQYAHLLQSFALSRKRRFFNSEIFKSIQKIVVLYGENEEISLNSLFSSTLHRGVEVGNLEEHDLLSFWYPSFQMGTSCEKLRSHDFISMHKTVTYRYQKRHAYEDCLNLCQSKCTAMRSNGNSISIHSVYNPVPSFARSEIYRITLTKFLR